MVMSVKADRYIKKAAENWYVLLIALAAVARLWKIETLPLGLHVDEAGMAYDAWSLANFGVDRYLKSFPVYLTNFGGGQSALYAYLCAVLIKIFGLSVTVIRLPGIIFSLLTLIFGIKIVRLKAKDHKNAALFAILFVACPYFLMASRVGLDCNLMLGMSTVFIYYFAKSVENGKGRLFLIVGISGGLILYTYAISYVVLPGFLLLSIGYLLYIKKISFRNILLMGIPIFALAFPLICVQAVNIFGLDEFQLGIFTITALKKYRGGEIILPNLHNLLVSLKSVLFYDWLECFSTQTYGTIYIISLPFVILGFIVVCRKTFQSIKNREWSIDVFILIWFAMELLAGSMLGGDGPNTNKLNGIFFTILYFILQGILLFKNRKVIYAIIMAAYVCSSLLFYRFYFISQVRQDAIHFYFAPEINEAVQYVENNLDDSQRKIYIGYSPETYIYYLLATQTSPYEFDIEENGAKSYKNYEFTLPEEIDETAAYIIMKVDGNWGEGNKRYNAFESGRYYCELLRDRGFNEYVCSNGVSVLYK